MDERLEDRSNLDKLHDLQISLENTEQELVKRDALLAAIVENASDAIIARDLKGNVIAWNKAATDIYGFTAEEMLGQPIYKIIPDDKLGEHDRWVDAIRRGETIEPIRTERLTKNGDRIKVIVSVSPVIARNGEILGASAIDHLPLSARV